MEAAVFFLLLAGLFAAFDLTPKKLMEAFRSERHPRDAASVKNAKRGRLEGKRSVVERGRADFLFTIEASGVGVSTGAFAGITLLCVAIGIAAGIYMNNPLLIVSAGVFCALLPYEYLKFRAIGYKRMLHAQLDAAITPITNGYLQTDDLVSSVENCLPQIDQPLHGIFRDELVWKTNMGRSLEKSLRVVGRRINNPLMDEWISTAIRSTANRNQKIGLLPIAQRMTDLKRIQAKVDTATSAIWKDHLVMSIIAVGSLPAIKLLNAEWYSFLRNTTFGKIIVCLTFLSVAFGTLYVFKVNKPVAMEE